MPSEVGQQTLPLFLRRAAALAEIEAEQAHIARPFEFGRIFYFAIRTPSSAWPTDQNGKLPKYLKGILHAATRSQFLKWLAALADPPNQSRFTLTYSDHLFVMDTYRPIFAKVRRKRSVRENVTEAGDLYHSTA